MNLKLLFLLSVIIAVTAVKKSYVDYKVYKVKPNSVGQVAVLHSVDISGIGEFWEDNIAVRNEAKVMVSKEKQQEFVSLMDSAQIETTVVIGDLQKVIDEQLKPAKPTNRFATESLYSMTWNRYYSVNEIYNWLDELESNYPVIVETVIWGYTNEDRQIKGIIIDHNPERHDKPIGVIEGAVHAREWISPATVTWIIKEFLISDDPEIRALAENFEWHILPVGNPDGYSYTFTDNRMWRKNRNSAYNTTCAAGIDDDMSNGVDLNRNFGYQWMVIGASNDHCSNTFAGPASFSEPETRAIANYVQSLNDDGEIIYYLAFHSYTQLVVVPYSHVISTEDMMEIENNNYADMFEIGSRAAAKLKQRFGTHYRVGVSAEVMYPMSGTSFDWVKHDIGVPVCYLLELRDLGEFGFLLPPEQIIPSNLEIMDFIKEMDRSTRALGYYTSGVVSVLQSMTVILCSLIFVLLKK